MANTKQVFLPQGSFDHPFDVSLVVEDGEFKAHKSLLSEASPFFKRMLNTEMREGNEGVIRLEMVKQPHMKDILEFIYGTGSLQISDEDHAKQLIAIADYLVLQQLKTQAERVLEKNLNTSNAISVYYYGERYQCTELMSVSRKFILTNFTTVAKTEEFCALSSKEVLMWISNDELVVNAEDDVFKIILNWINHAKSHRKIYFSELFRQVRLVYVSRDYLGGDVVTSDLVNDHEDCLDLVKHAMNLIDSEDYSRVTVKPRKSVQTPVLIVCEKHSGKEEQILCYYPREEKWSECHDKLPRNTKYVIACGGKLFVISETDSSDLFLCYDSFSNCWTTIPYKEHRNLFSVFVRNEEIYALVSAGEMFCSDCRVAIMLRSISAEWCQQCSILLQRRLSFLTKFSPPSNSWEDISSFHLASRTTICVLAKENFIYFLGGYKLDTKETLNRADRYNIETDTWDQIADLKLPRKNSDGVAAYGRIFIAGGTHPHPPSFEVYHETTDEWQLITGIRETIRGCRPWLCGVACVDGKLYVLKRTLFQSNCNEDSGIAREIVCFNLDSGEWKETSRMGKHSFVMGEQASLCSMMVFNGSKFFQQATILDGCPSILGAEAQSKSSGKRRCAVM